MPETETASPSLLGMKCSGIEVHCGLAVLAEVCPEWRNETGRSLDQKQAQVEVQVPRFCDPASANAVAAGTLARGEPQVCRICVPLSSTEPRAMPQCPFCPAIMVAALWRR